MTVKELKEALSLTFLCGEELSSKRTVNGCYSGDLLSWVMSKAKEGNVWLTVMGNVNSVGVAVLTDISCIVLTENAALDEDALSRAKQNDVIILTTEKTSYETAVEIGKLL